MKNVLLKIIIVIAFVGIFVVSGILIIKNRNVDLMAYNTINTKKQEINFTKLSDGATKVKDAFEGNTDVYADFVNAAILNTNMSIDFYLDYLVNIRTISRGEQDMLIEKYLEYGKAVEKAQTALDLYNTTYKQAEIAVDIQKSIVASSGTFVATFIEVYEASSDFYKNLVDIVDKYSHNGNTEYNYVEIRLHMANALADLCVPVVKENMQKRINVNSNNDVADLMTTKSTLDYYNFTVKANEIHSTGQYESVEFEEFFILCRDVDVVDLITQKSEYVKTLSEEQNVKAAQIVTFIKLKFGIEV